MTIWNFFRTKQVVQADRVEKQFAVKTCEKCGKSKTLKAYDRHNLAKDGHRNTCRACRKIGSAAVEATNGVTITILKVDPDQRSALQELAKKTGTSANDVYLDMVESYLVLRGLK
jgi:hypothetical protein